ncbi:MAG: chemotaxis response regulator protein-glutamate methylesterase [Desulfovibrio sp.]|nr:chemotaxis response regulator protein-glutamate methylesterase [Desulfovibrio sp.]
MVKVLVVDDSAFVRRSLISILEKDKEIQVTGTAADGEEAVAKAAQLDPDVITMDVEMPKMNGLKALERIMAANPTPVLMVSSMTSEGASTTLRAMELGAMDYIPKISSGNLHNTQRLENELCSKIKAIARRKAFLRLKFKNAGGRQATVASCTLPSRTQQTPPAPHIFHAGGSVAFEIVAIGVSTGGPPAVQKVLSELPGNFPVPILIAQHMPASFTGPFADRLNNLCAISVKEAEPIERVRPGTVYICPGGKHLRLENRSGSLMAVVTEEPKDALYKPSANVLMETAGIAAGNKALGVTLTGMGYDGLEGTKVLKQRGGWAIAQNEESCVVYGMPKAVVDAGLADEIVDIKDMSATILSHFQRKA